MDGFVVESIFNWCSRFFAVKRRLQRIGELIVNQVKLLAVLGDSTDCLIVDPQSVKVASYLKGHLDYSFSCAWDPSSQILATGNQDKTCRLWDVRNTSKSLAVLKGNIGAVRGMKFSPDWSYLAFAEPADFVHVYGVNVNYSSAQEIYFFGEISGISFSPDFFGVIL